MPISHEQFCPYISVTVASVANNLGSSATVTRLSEYFRNSLGLTAVYQSGPLQDGKLHFSYIHFQVRKKPSWTTDNSLEDVANHLALVASRNGYVAILLTDPAVGQKLAKRLGTDDGLNFLSKIAADRLNGAFVRGATRTMWLSGIHSPTSLKPTAKVFTGMDLADALDPHNDQTYFFTSLRADSTVGSKGKVGISPERSKVWSGPSNGWADFRDNLTALFIALSKTRRISNRLEAPFATLASPVTSVSNVTGAYDAAIIPTELLSSDEVDPDRFAFAERWAYGASFTVSSKPGPDFSAKVFFRGVELGQIDVKVDLARPLQVKLQIAGTPVPGHEDAFGEAQAACSEKGWLKVYYDSGFTLADSKVFQQRFRDMPFRQWSFFDLGDYEPSREKPGRPTVDKNGKAITVEHVADTGNQKSLFCWILNEWPESEKGWLACDDGGGEIADFVFFERNPNRLTLIHIKASGDRAKAGEHRRISVSDFEIVIGQAVKNLRRLDRDIMATDFAAGASKQVGKLVWKDRVPQPDRSGFLAELEAAGNNCARRVIVLQPRPLRTELERLRALMDAGEKDQDQLVLLQLDALLCATESSCRSLGAEFIVISDNG